ncbi:MAG: tetratricopeptide repeat protein [Planctomycetes bacterium]|nr:tetratricopeptide repeat protein [Planctomycetota bacterium]
MFMVRRRITLLICAVVGIVLVIAQVIRYEQDRPLREIEDQLRTHQTSAAFRRLSQFLKHHPHDSRALAFKARILVEVGQYPEAIQLFERNGAASSADLHAWAKAHLLRQEWSSALPILQRILKLNPDDADGLHEIAAVHAFLGDYQQALAYAERMTRLQGQEARAYFQIGTLHESVGNKKSAADAWNKVLSFSPDANGLQVPAAEFFVMCGSTYLDLGRIEEATSAFRKSLSLQDTAEARLQLGNALLQSGQLPLAIESWKAAIALSPGLKGAREVLAEAAFQSRHYDEAREWMAPLVAANEVNSKTAHLMRRICLAAGDTEGSQHWQDRTTELNRHEHLIFEINQMLQKSPNSEWSQAYRAYRFAESGNWNEARQMIDALEKGTIAQEPFVRQLSSAARQGGGLPSLSLIPVHDVQ